MKKNPYIQLIRPRQWIKNFFIAAPLIFGLKLLDPLSVGMVIIGFVVFCFIASSIYILNDLCDIKADRIHPKNKNRPLASGKITITQAILLMLSLLGITAIITAITLMKHIINPYFYLIALVYLIINVSYSLGLKHVPLFEMFLVASGYVLRVIAGCMLVLVSPSPWIIIVTGVVSMLIVAGKRRSELVNNMDSKSGRKSLSGYNLAFIDSMISIFGTATIITYMLYTLSPEATFIHHTKNLIYTSLFVTYGVTRYILLTKVHNDAESPTDLVTTDPGIFSAVALWVISLIILFYF